jgi:hypothetical protein
MRLSLVQLEDVNNSMQLLVQGETNITVQITYTVQRHREILHEYQDEFRKTKVLSRVLCPLGYWLMILAHGAYTWGC